MERSPIIDNSRSGVRSNHNLSFNWLGSTDFGVLRPFHWEELLPTDKVVKCKPLIELQSLPLASPTFGKMDIYVHYFFVPTRLIWDAANDTFSRKGALAGSDAPCWDKDMFTYAYLGIANNTDLQDLERDLECRALYKHWTSFGLPPFFAAVPDVNISVKNENISVLPLRAYNQIWWDFYRDPELIPDSNKDLYLDKSSGLEYGIDYDDPEDVAAQNKYIPRVRTMKDVWIASLFASAGASPAGIDFANPGTNTQPLAINSEEKTSQQIRRIEALTRLAERLSLSGKRSIDSFFSLYGVKPDFMKMEMCQYLGGAKSTVLVSDITSSADTASIVPDNEGAALGQKAGSTYATFDQLNIEFSAHEPGYLMGIVSVMPHVHLVQGLSKRWKRETLDDFFNKSLEHVGQVAVSKKEVATSYFYRGAGVSYDKTHDDDTFAFADPYYEYKQRGDVLAGDFMYYHNVSQGNNPNKDIAYMQSMGIYVDYPTDREYNAENMLLNGLDCNKIFFYQGGNVWDNVDDHFHLNIDVQCVINRPMDGYAIPTIETTENPHKSTAPVGGDRIL